MRKEFIIILILFSTIFLTACGDTVPQTTPHSEGFIIINSDVVNTKILNEELIELGNKEKNNPA